MRSFARLQRRDTAEKDESARTAPKVIRRASGAPSLRRVEQRFQFFRSIAGELRKVTWPSREETQRLTWLVVAVSTATGLALGGVDFVFTELVKFLVTLGS